MVLEHLNGHPQTHAYVYEYAEAAGLGSVLVALPMPMPYINCEIPNYFLVLVGS